jgi:hypothetical protein
MSRTRRLLPAGSGLEVRPDDEPADDGRLLRSRVELEPELDLRLRTRPPPLAPLLLLLIKGYVQHTKRSRGMES